MYESASGEILCLGFDELISSSSSCSVGTSTCLKGNKENATECTTGVTKRITKSPSVSGVGATDTSSKAGLLSIDKVAYNASCIPRLRRSKESTCPDAVLTLAQLIEEFLFEEQGRLSLDSLRLEFAKECTPGIDDNTSISDCYNILYDV